ncbi:glycoside hydrolase family 19 protein [Pseudomonas sp. NPDC087697]|uniref:glycoside hydrolase family 19 protein n=1 Tax=Pseudomonas sp. NPDC087697 TaxID=3364447 RepID=UPI003830B170
MTETTSKVEKWSYPFKVGGAEAKDPQQYYKALAQAKDGYYPLGSNGLWHGGVHFDEATGLVGDKAEVRCIADGEVVAYRIDEVYPKSDFGSTHSVFSTGFVLVKHRLEVPVPPAPAPALGAPAAAATPGPSLTFFSLYMHLLDWEGYRLTPALDRPAFWSGGISQVKASANDKILGLRVRQGPKNNPGYGTVLTVLPRGTLVETGEEDHGWLKVVNVTPADASLPPGTGWVYKGEMTDGPTPNSYVIGVAAKDEMTPPQKGLAVHAGANQTSATTAILPIGTQVKIGNDGANAEYQKLIEIVSGSSIPALTASNGILGYIRKSLLETKSEPAEKNTVHLLERPFPIKAGSLIGHVGKYQNHSDPAPKNLLHLEVFSCEDVKAFTELSKSKASSLPATEKTLLKIPKDSLLITHVQGMNATNPPKVTDAHKKVGYDFLVPVSVLEALPAEKKIKVPVVMGGTTTYTFWWRLDGLLGDADGNEINGWFAEPDTTLSRHSPFEWEGFTFIEETISNVDHLAAFLHAQESLNDEERATYLPNVGNADDSLTKKQLYKILDKNGDSKLKPEEITEALGKPWFSQPISQMVSRYESEWQYKSEKWDALDELMGHSDSDPHKGWVEEKARIERLGWWDKLAGQNGVSGDINVQHIHPVGLISNFLRLGSSKCKKCGKNIALSHEFMKRISAPSVTDGFVDDFISAANLIFSKYEVNSCSQIIHLLGQGKHETGRFKKFRESLRYSRQSYTPTSLYNMAPTAINSGFTRLGLNLTQAEKIQYVDDHLIDNDPGYGRHSFGSTQYPQNDYRGRGLLHLTHYANYHSCAQAIGVAIDASPELVESDTKVIIETGLWFWKSNSIGPIADDSGLSMDQKIRAVTRVINPGLKGLVERVEFTKDIANIFEELYGACSA